jgi:polyisoprenoid-binding protein YceI
MHQHYKIFVIGILIMIAVACNYGFASAQPEKDEEIYHILQKGYISIKGQTNIFDFTGKAIQHEGELKEENGKYTGTVILRFNNLDMNLPYAKKVLNDPEYMDANHYPIIKILLDNFHPEESPAQVNGALTLHGITHPITIETRFNYISPVVAIEGKLKISQSSFNVKPYNWGVVKVDDALEIIFRVFFCEDHKGMPEYDMISQAEIKRLFEEYNIKILIEKNYFGCEELKKKNKTK